MVTTNSSLPDGLPGRVRRLRVLTILLVLALAAAAFFLLRDVRSQTYRLSITAGDVLGHRHQLLTALVPEARRQGLRLDIEPTTGSDSALDAVAEHRLDAALVQGGLKPRDDVRQVAVLVPEPLHLLVKPALLAGGLEGLRGATLSLGSPGSGTRVLSLETLELVGLKPQDYETIEASYADLQELEKPDLPDGLFIVSSLPSELAQWFVTHRGYRLMPLPFGKALALRDNSVQDVIIPAYTYSVIPPVPTDDVHTFAPWMSIVAHKDVPDAAVIRLLESVFDGNFFLATELSGLSADEVVRHRELTLHPGTTTFLHRNEPVVTGEFIEGVENLRSFIVSGAVALFLAWRWFRGSKSVGFERYLDDVSRLEREILEQRKTRRLDGAATLALEDRLTKLKCNALEQFSTGALQGDEAMSSFLTHVSDVRQCLYGSANSPTSSASTDSQALRGNQSPDAPASP